MKSSFLVLIASLMFTATSFAAVRDLKKAPLTKAEWSAYRASKSFIKELKAVSKPECVNADFEAGALPVTIQFFNEGDKEEDASCTDPHYSVEVDVDSEGNVVGMSLIDA